MPEAMPGSNAQPMLVANHATNATNERNVRHQDSPKSSHVPDAAKAVDNRVPVFYEVDGHTVFGVRAVA